jgi:hypothetical protein
MGDIPCPIFTSFDKVLLSRTIGVVVSSDLRNQYRETEEGSLADVRTSYTEYSLDFEQLLDEFYKSRDGDSCFDGFL